MYSKESHNTFKKAIFWTAASIVALSSAFGVYSEVMYRKYYSRLSLDGVGKIENTYNANEYDYRLVPYEIKKAADSLEAKLNDGKDAKRVDLLKLLSDTKGKEIVIFTISGGIGGTLLDNQQGWKTVIQGIESVLNDIGYNTLTVDYGKPEPNLRQFIGELTTGFYSGAKELASIIDFLQKYNPDLKVLMVGESFGAMRSNTAMEFFMKNPNVYSIQVGIPGFPKLSNNNAPNATLRIDSNGVESDAFHEMDVPYIVLNVLKNLEKIKKEGWAMAGLAPGHYYNWGFEEVRKEITSYLNKVFGRQLN